MPVAGADDLGGILAGVVERGQALLPHLGAAVLLLALGWVLARLLGRAATRLVARVEGHPQGRALERELRAAGIDRMASVAVGQLVFWAVFVVFVALASEVLGMVVLTSGLGELARYVPNVIAAVLVAATGLVLGNVVRTTVRSAARRGGLGQAALLGEAFRAVILMLAVVVAIDQIGVDSTLLIVAVAVLLGATIGGAALAFGLGARGAAGNIIATHYVTQLYRAGQTVRIGDVRGEIVAFQPTGVVLRTAEGRVFVPAGRFLEERSVLLPGEES